MKDIVLKYAKQPSTWRGLAIIAGILGAHISPESVEAIGTAVVSVIGAVEIVRNEHKSEGV